MKCNLYNKQMKMKLITNEMLLKNKWNEMITNSWITNEK